MTAEQKRIRELEGKVSVLESLVLLKEKKRKELEDKIKEMEKFYSK